MKAIAMLLAVAITLGPAAAAQAQSSPSDKVKAALDKWLALRTGPEGVTGAAAYVSFKDDSSAEAFSGTVGRAANDGPVTKDTLFQIGSVTKSFAAAVLLQLEGLEQLTLDQTVGYWLHDEYPGRMDWKDVSIRQLLNMTSPIPNYSETQAMSKIWTQYPDRVLQAPELVALALQEGLPKPPAWFYSNTNYILAGMIAAKAGKAPFAELVQRVVIRPLKLEDTFYVDDVYPTKVTTRLSRGYFENAACSDYQPHCTEPWNRPLLNREVSRMSLSWAQAAGGAIANARDTTRWARAIFEGKVVKPEQQKEWLSLVSQMTGKPISDVSSDDPKGFALGLGRGMHGPNKLWFYQGTTMGFRTLYVWFTDEDMMVTVQTNSQPPDGEDKLGMAVELIHDAVKR
jgi:D-alanyl-D-alanine carboxypeptidase